MTTLSARFPPPRGAKRGPLLPNGFGSWLRTLPLAADDTPVRTFRGDVLHAAGDPRVAAVVAIDVGRSDLQQCADAVIRLHAEWLWSRGRRSQSYTAASGTELPFTRYARGERVVNDGPRISWQARAAPASDHGAFRSYLDTVFAWANTVSLAKQAKVVPPAELRPGDFFVMGGNPGHSVLVLDLASDPHGKRFALLGQSFMPAQSFHVLRPAPEGVWFELDEARPIATPFWKPFEWKMLRRLDD